MSSWFRLLSRGKSELIAALFAAMAVFLAASTGCGSSVVPSGFNSAANGQQVIANGTPHMIGFRVAEALPATPAGQKIAPSFGDMWFFVTTNRTNTAGPAMTNIQFLVNGTQKTTTILTLPGNKTAWIQSTGIPTGALVQVDATVSGQSRLSNSITIPAGGYAADNKPPGLVPVQPAQSGGSATAPRPTTLEFSHANAATASTYLSMVIDIGVDGNNNLVPTPVSLVELLQAGAFVTGTAPNTLIAAFQNPANLPASQGAGLFYSVVCLDSNGFGNGTTSDGNPFAPGTWIFFQ